LADPAATVIGDRLFLITDTDDESYVNINKIVFSEGTNKLISSPEKSKAGELKKQSTS